MSIVSRWIAWDARCRSGKAYGATAGDTYYQGSREYVEPFPCPNGLPIDHRLPGECEAWRQRIEKAKADIHRHQKEIGVRIVADSFSVQEILSDVEIIRSWAKSLLKTKSATGSLALTSGAAN